MLIVSQDSDKVQTKRFPEPTGHCPDIPAVHINLASQTFYETCIKNTSEALTFEGVYILS
jgi:hypothetical protein